MDNLLKCGYRLSGPVETQIKYRTWISGYFVDIDNQVLVLSSYLQCFDAVGWATGRASGL